MIHQPLNQRQDWFDVLAAGLEQHRIETQSEAAVIVVGTVSPEGIVSFQRRAVGGKAYAQRLLEEAGSHASRKAREP